MFNKDENVGIIQNIELLNSIVDEIVIIDSSKTSNFLKLKTEIEKYPSARIVRVFPLGYMGALKVFALNNINSDQVVYLDPDEVPNDKFITFISTLKERTMDASGYYVLRFYVESRFFEYEFKIFKKDCIGYIGMIHERPIVKGTVEKLSDDIFIYHKTAHTASKDENHRYMKIESYVRPYSKFYLTNLSGGRKIYRAILGEKNKILSKYAVSLIIILETVETFMQTFFESNPIKLRRYRKAKFTFRYNLAKFRYFERIENKDRILEINKEIIRNGGVTKYLRLDEVGYVESLANSFKWDKEGVEVLEYLLNYRFDHGKCLERFQ